MTAPIDDRARHAVDEFLLEQQASRRHLVVALSGGHAYGFPSPDSDFDVKAIHVSPTRALLGLTAPEGTCDRSVLVDGVEIDYTSNEVGAALAGLIKGNGNYLERLLGRHLLLVDPALEGLATLVRESVSRRFYHHYLGFARQQQAMVEKSGAPTVKGVLYVLRTALTGAHLLRTGELRVDINDNLDEYGFADARELIDRKKAGERTVLDEASRPYWQERMKQAFDLLDRTHAQSRLPPEPGNCDALESWLVDLRLRDLR